AASADEEIDREAAALRLGNQAAEFLDRGRKSPLPARGGAGDRLARRVVKGDAQMQLAPIRRETLGGLDLAYKAAGEAVAATDDAEPHAALDEALHLAAQIRLEQPHQRLDLGGGTPPIVGREG